MKEPKRLPIITLSLYQRWPRHGLLTTKMRVIRYQLEQFTHRQARLSPLKSHLFPPRLPLCPPNLNPLAFLSRRPDSLVQQVHQSQHLSQERRLLVLAEKLSLESLALLALSALSAYSTSSEDHEISGENNPGQIPHPMRTLPGDMSLWDMICEQSRILHGVGLWRRRMLVGEMNSMGKMGGGKGLRCPVESNGHALPGFIVRV